MQTTKITYRSTDRFYPAWSCKREYTGCRHRITSKGYRPYHRVLTGKMDGAFIETAVAESYQKNYPDLEILFDVPYDTEAICNRCLQRKWRTSQRCKCKESQMSMMVLWTNSSQMQQSFAKRSDIWRNTGRERCSSGSWCKEMTLNNI